MTLYLTEATEAAEIDRAAASGFVHGVKCYPAGSTTHSDAGVTSLARCQAVLERMEERDVVLQLHGEVTGDDVDPYDRESVFIERELAPLVKRHPRLRIVLEHVTTRAGVEFVRAAGARVGATITPQHLLLNRGAMFKGGLRPHLYCLPVLKRERDREALIDAATSGRSAVLPRHRQRPACEDGQGIVLRLRRHLLGAGGDRALCARVRAARAGSTASRPSRVSTGPISTACRATRGRSFSSGGRGPCRRAFPFGADEVVPMGAGEPLEWKLRDAASP